MKNLVVQSYLFLIMKDMAEIYVKKNVARGAAALSYYLTLSIFPLLICVSAILGNTWLVDTDLGESLREFLPDSAFYVIYEFLRYVGRFRSDLMLFLGVIAMLTTSSAAFRSFTGTINEIQGSARHTGIWRGIFSFVSSIVFLLSIYISGLVIITGEWIVEVIGENFTVVEILELWNWMRFIFLFLLLFCIIFLIYMFTAPKGTRKRACLPGAITAAVVLVGASMVYSHMVTASLRYAILYGSLASFIIMMVWLYTCGIILIMGDVLNITVARKKRNRMEQESTHTA